MKIDGSCHCGHITYRAEVDPDRVYVYHCTDCQSITGSAFSWAVHMPEEDFELLSGAPKTYVQTAESGATSHRVFVCHCADCQSITGSAFRWAVHIAEENLELLSGTPKTYVKTADSGATNHQVFCPECASPLYSFSVGDGPKTLNLRLGTARQRDQLRPKFQYWCRSAQPWAMELAAVNQLDKQ